MTIREDNARENAQRARADQANAELHGARACVESLVMEVRALRRELLVAHRCLEDCRRQAIAAIPHARDERTALALGDIALRASPDAPVRLRAVRSV